MSFFNDVFIVLWLAMPIILIKLLPIFPRWWNSQPLWPIDLSRQTWSDLFWLMFFATGMSIIIGMAVVIAEQVEISEVWGEHLGAMLLHIFTLASGALLVNVMLSRFKRRMGRDAETEWLVADQFDVIVGAYVLTAIVDPNWFAKELIPGRWLAILAVCAVYFVADRAFSRFVVRREVKSQLY